MSIGQYARRVVRKLVPAEVLAELRREILRNQDRLARLERRLELVHEALGRIEGRQVAQVPITRLEQAEWRVYSQWGEDGILDWLTRHIAIDERRFVEIGVESYEEANTRYLLSQDGWSGLVLDRDGDGIERLHRSRLHWHHDLRAVHATVTRDNVNALLREHGMSGRIGLLSIDIDGIDWWLWDAIDAVEPAIVVVEYNHRFGPTAAVTVPYAADFDRRTAHPSLLYYGASLEALRRLGAAKGFALVGCSRHGLNAFFVQRALRPAELPELASAEAWIGGGFSEAHTSGGERIRLTPQQESALLRELPLVEIGPDGRPTGA